MKELGLKKFKPGRQEVLEKGEKVSYGKFDTIQRKEISQEEIVQGKFEKTVRNRLSDYDRNKLLQINTENDADASNRQMPLQMKKESKADVPDRHKLLQINKDNNTGLPDDLKARMENLSGLSMDDVRVHYNSDKPAKIGALAYTQGTDIHVAPGREKDLPHEAWHVVQQAQGRVQSTMQMKGMAINDDDGLEQEADEMGQTFQNVNNSADQKTKEITNKNPELVVQRQIESNELSKEDKKKYKELLKKFGETFKVGSENYYNMERYGILTFVECCEQADGVDQLELLVNRQIAKIHPTEPSADPIVPTEAMPVAAASAEEPKTKEPKTEKTQTEKPKTEEPKTEKPETEKPKKRKQKAKPVSMSLSEFNASLPPKNQWEQPLHITPGDVTSSPLPQPTQSRSVPVIDRLQAWKPSKGHSGEKNKELSVKDLEEIMEWLDKNHTKYGYLAGNGTGEYSGKYQFKIYHRVVTHDQKQATYHISISESVYHQLLEKYPELFAEKY